MNEQPTWRNILEERKPAPIPPGLMPCEVCGGERNYIVGGRRTCAEGCQLPACYCEQCRRDNA